MNHFFGVSSDASRHRALDRLVSRAASWLVLGYLFCILVASSLPARAHDIPRSQVEVRSGIRGADVAITFSVLGFLLDYPAVQLGGQALEKAATTNRDMMASTVAKRFVFIADGHAQEVVPSTSSEFLPERKAIRLHLHYAWQAPPRRIEVQIGRLFPVDPNHTVFVSVYEGPDGGKLVREAILNRTNPTLAYDVGSGQSIFAVIRQFVREGIHHIFIGPDHILFIIGLLLLGGGIKRLLKIVTAFTLTHSMTLVLATLNLLNPSPHLIEPAIALSIIFVGIHTLLTQQSDESQPEVRDKRVVLAGLFGLIHGFGFASVLREMELPRAALGWSLFSFNVGVEIGQMCIVLAIAPLLALLCRKSPKAGRIVILIASWGVILAGAYWFGERLVA